MIDRIIAAKITSMASKFPVVTLTGARQCGKSTLLRNILQDYKYVSLEDPDIRKAVAEDPRGFLGNFDDKTIIDESQYVPELFSYIQTKVDEENRSGMYVLSGSQNFLLMEKISQSLAGRAAVLKLAPLSISELRNAGLLPDTMAKLMLRGGYPRLYDMDIEPQDYYPSYVATYLERDVRLVRNVADFSRFELFLRMCAARIGQLLNIQSLANDCGLSPQTAKDWLSILEASYIVFRLQPYYRNLGKRLVKSSKLFFYDTGLAASLIGINTADQMTLSPSKGALFENLVVSEFLKRKLFAGAEPRLYFWRDSNDNEVDLIEEDGGGLDAYEIKSGSLLRDDYFKGLAKFAGLAGISPDSCAVVYGGDLNYVTSRGRYISWCSL